MKDELTFVFIHHSAFILALAPAARVQRFIGARTLRISDRVSSPSMKRAAVTDANRTQSFGRGMIL